MHRLRMGMAAALVWAFALYNIERFHEPINLASFVYVLAAGVSVAVVLTPRAAHAPWGAILGGVLLVFVIYKSGRGLPLLGQHLPLTITEICALTVTTFLAHRLARYLREFEEAAAEAALREGGPAPASFEFAQSELYREVRRARRQKRPLAVAALAPQPQAAAAMLPRMVEEIQKTCAQKYLERKLAALLTRTVDDAAWIIQHGDYFLVLFPEHGREEAMEALRRVEQAASEELGLPLRQGVASFPDEEITFTGLIERAERLMRGESPLPALGWRLTPVPNEAVHPHGNGNGDSNGNGRGEIG